MSEAKTTPSAVDLDRLLVFSMRTSDQALAYAGRLRAALAGLVAVHDSDAEDDDGEAWGPALAEAREALAE